MSKDDIPDEEAFKDIILQSSIVNNNTALKSKYRNILIDLFECLLKQRLLKIRNFIFTKASFFRLFLTKILYDFQILKKLLKKNMTILLIILFKNKLKADIFAIKQ